MQSERAGRFEPALKATATKSGSSLPLGSWSWIVRSGFCWYTVLQVPTVMESCMGNQFFAALPH